VEENMKLATSCLVAVMATIGAQSVALADDWYERYDVDHDHHWSYNEFRDANLSYWKLHKDEKALKDAELRAEFDRMAAGHPEYVDVETVRTYHHW
jgi:hypothetical protein